MHLPHGLRSVGAEVSGEKVDVANQGEIATIRIVPPATEMLEWRITFTQAEGRQAALPASPFAVEPSAAPVHAAVENEAGRAAVEAAAKNRAWVAATAKAKAAQASLEGWEMGPFIKHPEPVLRPRPESVFKCPIMGKDTRWEEVNTYNPAAVAKDGKIYLLYRADGHNPECGWGRVCRIGLATSEDGIHFTRRPKPVVYPDNDEFKKYEWAGGCEDLHIIEGEDGVYYMNYTTHTSHSAPIADTMSVASSRDLVHWTKHGPAFQKYNPDRVNGSRSGVVVSRREGDRLIAAKINGKYWMYFTHPCGLAWSENLVDWHWTGKAIWYGGGHESGAIALLRDDGILLMTQGGAGPLGGWVLWQALIDRANLSPRPLRRTCVLKEQKQPFLWPEYEWEIHGMTDYTTVANTLVPFKGKWFLYYGAADHVIGVATCPDKPHG